MKILITGGRGMLGRTLQKEFADCELSIADLPECDITDAAGFERQLAACSPGAVIHCAVMTAVDKCESKPEKAYRLNAAGSANVAAACQRPGTRLIAISTDYVFRGDLGRPYHEFDTPGALTLYGASKYAGEQLIRNHCSDHLICRISWLYGAGGPSFVHAMMSLAAGSHPELKVVADQIGNPTSAKVVARKLRELLVRPELVGTYHLSCEGEASWYEFACEIFRLSGRKQCVAPCMTAEFPRLVLRPVNSRLEKRMLKLQGFSPMPHWKQALAEFMAEEFPKIL